MFVRLGSTRTAINLPLLTMVFTGLAVVAGFGAVISEGLSLTSVGFSTLGLILILVSAGQLRWFRAGEHELRIRNVYGVERIRLAAASLAMEARHGQNGSIYTLVVADGDRERSFEVGSAGSKPGSERIERLMNELMFPESARDATVD